MKFTLEVNSSNEDPRLLRHVAALLIMLADENVPAGSNDPTWFGGVNPKDIVSVPMPEAAREYASPPPPAPQRTDSVAWVVPPPPPTSAPDNILPFPPAPQTADTASVANVPETVTPPPGVVEYDSAGLMWDARVHMEKRQKKKDGTWKIRKGIDAAIVSHVVAELFAQRQAPASVLLPLPLPPTPSAAAGATALPVPPAPTPMPAAPVAPVGNISPVAAGLSYIELVTRLSKLTQTKKFDVKDLAGILQPLGIPNLGALNGMLDKIPAVASALDVYLLERGHTP